MQSNKKTLSIAVFTLLVGVFCIETYALYRINPFACEDAYITFRFAKNFAEGNGPVFNPGDPVEGYSNFLWMSLIALGHSLGISMPAFSQVAGVLFNTLSLLLVWYLPRRFCGFRGPTTAFGPLLYMLFLPFQFFAFAGLETSLYTFLVLLSLLLVLWAGSRPLPFACASVVFLMLALTRPEGIIFFVFYGGYCLWKCIVKRESIKPYLPGAALFVVVYGIFVLWRLSYFGLPLPNTYYAKGSFPFLLRTGLGLLINKGFITNYCFFFFLFLIGFARIARSKYPFINITGVFATAGALFSIGFSGFDWMPFFRYTVPIVPLLILLSQVLFSELWLDFKRTASVYRRVAWGVLTAALLFFAVEQYIRDLTFNIRWKEISDFAFHNQKKMGNWIKEELPDTTVMAMGDVGRLAYFAEAPILDIFGLNSREFAALRKEHGAPQLQLSRAALSFDSYKHKELELLLKRAPEYVFLYNAQLKIAGSFPGSSTGIADQTAFTDRYEYLDTFHIIPRFSNPAWPRLRYCIDVIDLSSGLLAWIQDGWGYDIYIRKDRPGKHFTLKKTDEGLIEDVIVSP